MKCLLYVILLVLPSLLVQGQYMLRKCCPLGYRVAVTLDECEPSSTSDPAKPWIIPGNDLLFTGAKTPFYEANLTSDPTRINMPCHVMDSISLKLRNDSSIPADMKIDSATGVLHTLLAVPSLSFPAGKYCVDTTRLVAYNGEDTDDAEGVGRSKVEVTVALACPCASGTCQLMCCPRGHMMNLNIPSNENQCEKVSSDWSSWSVDNITVAPKDRKFFTVYDATPYKCENRSIYLLNNYTHDKTKKRSEIRQFKILANGDLKIENVTALTESGQYCVGVMREGEITTVNAFLCLPDRSKEKLNEWLHFVLYTPMFIIGGLFLLATLVMLGLLPDLRKGVRGLSLLGHCAAMLLAYIALAFVQFCGKILPLLPCQLLAYTIQFSFLCGMFWLSVMCFDIYIKFNFMRNPVSSSLSTERRQMWFYTGFAVGVPVLISLVTLLVSLNLDLLPLWVPDPGFGVTSCWFGNDNSPILTYFYGPIGLLLIGNFVMFVLTVLKILSVYRDTAILRRSSVTASSSEQSQIRAQKRKQRKSCILYIKLFGLMGIPWVMEIVSWAVGGEDYYWYLTDAINFLRTIFIFILFCCKPKVWKMLKEKYFKTVPSSRATTSDEGNFSRINPTFQTLDS